MDFVKKNNKKIIDLRTSIRHLHVLKKFLRCLSNDMCLLGSYKMICSLLWRKLDKKPLKNTTIYHDFHRDELKDSHHLKIKKISKFCFLTKKMENFMIFPKLWLKFYNSFPFPRYNDFNISQFKSYLHKIIICLKCSTPQISFEHLFCKNE